MAGGWLARAGWLADWLQAVWLAGCRAGCLAGRLTLMGLVSIWGSQLQNAIRELSTDPWAGMAGPKLEILWRGEGGEARWPIIQEKKYVWGETPSPQVSAWSH